MKRELVCAVCAMKNNLGEKRVYGLSIGRFICDFCNAQKERGSDACAVSYGPGIYDWEDEYLTW